MIFQQMKVKTDKGLEIVVKLDTNLRPLEDIADDDGTVRVGREVWDMLIERLPENTKWEMLEDK